MVALGGLLGGAGCAGMSPTQSGYLLGSIAGGAAAGPAGAAVGSLVGTLAGALAAKPLEQHREKVERKQLQDQLGAPAPVTAQQPTAPSEIAQPDGPMVMARVWVDERIERGRVVAGHFEERSIPQSSEETAPRPVVASRPL